MRRTAFLRTKTVKRRRARQGERERPLERVLGNRTMRRLLGPAGEPLDAATRARMERALGADLGDVRVHTGGQAAAEVRRHGAEAMTVGPDIAFEQGRYRPGTPIGDALLAHELAHTLQQRDGGAGRAPSRQLEADANRSAVGAVGALWGGATRAAAGVGPRLRSGTQMQFLVCEAEPAYEVPEYLGPHSREALEQIRRIMESGQALESMIVIGTVLTLAKSSPPETLASRSYDVTPQAEALRAVPVIVRSRMTDVITLLLVQHENEMNEREREFWHNILRQLNAL